MLGSVPDDTGTAVVLSLSRLNQVRSIDVVNRTITVDAGVILQTVQETAAAHGLLFPLSLAAEGSCTIGGNLSTNAGGTAVLRYGNTRELCLGLEAVTPHGAIWDGLRALRKDNTGYDLRDLLIGAEGTLGIITGAVMKLFPAPKAAITALVALDSPRHALGLLGLMQDACGAALTGFELMSGVCLQLVADQFPQLQQPFTTRHAQYVLLELSSSESEPHAYRAAGSGHRRAVEQGVCTDAVVATSLAQSRGLWNLREHIPLAQAAAGKNIKHDISLPISTIADFILETDAALAAAYPDAQVICFGHLGDGNLHYNVAPKSGAGHDAFLANQPRHQPHRQRPGREDARFHLGRTRHRRPQARRPDALQGRRRTGHDACHQRRARPARHYEPWKNSVIQGETMMRLFPAVAACAVFASASAQTIYKCTFEGKPSYGDRPCATGPSTVLAGAPAADPETAARLARQNALATQLTKRDTARAKQEDAAAQRARRAAHVQHLKCAKLRLRQQWAQEDVRRASDKHVDNARLKARRQAEAMALECPS